MYLCESLFSSVGGSDPATTLATGGANDKKKKKKKDKKDNGGSSSGNKSKSSRSSSVGSACAKGELINMEYFLSELSDDESASRLVNGPKIKEIQVIIRQSFFSVTKRTAGFNKNRS